MPMKSSVIGGCYGGTLPINVHQVDLDSTYKFIDIDSPCLEKPTSHLFNLGVFDIKKWIPRYHHVRYIWYLRSIINVYTVILYINVQICTVSTNTQLSLTFNLFAQVYPNIDKRWLGSVSKPCTPVVHIKIAGKWMFIPLKMVLIGIDP